MSKTNVESHGQSGGITAGNVNVYPAGQKQPRTRRAKSVGWWKATGGAIAVVASIVAVLEYLDIKPWRTGVSDKKTINVTSFNQSGGITAGEVHVGSQPRHVTPNVESQLQQNLKKNRKVVVTAVMGDQEAFQFANEIKSFLLSQGYDVDGVSQSVFSEPVVGQIIRPTESGFEIIIGARG